MNALGLQEDCDRDLAYLITTRVNLAGFNPVHFCLTISVEFFNGTHPVISGDRLA